jgi:subtilisin family serine protease
MRSGNTGIVGLAILALAQTGCGEHSPVAPSSDSAGSAIDPQSIMVADVAAGGAPGGVGYPSVPVVPDQVVVRLADGLDLPTFNDVWGTSTVLELEGGDYALVSSPAGLNPWYLGESMEVSGDCLVAEPNFEVESPESNQGVVAFYEAGKVYADVLDQDAILRIGTPQAHLTATGSGVVVAIVDTGIDGTHPDLTGHVSPGWDFVDGDPDPMDIADGIDQDGDGLVDEAAGHGTHVAGIVRTVAPGASLLPVRVLNTEGVGTSVDVARGVRYAVDQGAHVINLSLGMNAVADVIKDAIQYAEGVGVLVTSSAGNRGVEDNHHFPARISQAMSVAATNAADLKASFSSYGSPVSICAPGEGILSTYLDHEFAVWSGTSFSTPMVSGAAALWLEISPGSSPSSTVDVIEETSLALDFSGFWYDGKMGEGRLDVAALVGESGSSSDSGDEYEPEGRFRIR